MEYIITAQDITEEYYLVNAETEEEALAIFKDDSIDLRPTNSVQVAFNITIEEA